MNYLAHLHLAHTSDTPLLGNFMGDFIKGGLAQVPSELRTGVALHRFIDSSTDAHPEVRALRAQMPAPWRRFGGIVLDVYFDHLLVTQSRYWQLQSIESLLAEFYRQLAGFEGDVSSRFIEVREGLLQHRWLIQYRQQQFCLQGLRRIERRFRRRVSFAEAGFAWCQQHHNAIAAGFNRLYPEMQASCQQWASDNLSL